MKKLSYIDMNRYRVNTDFEFVFMLCVCACGRSLVIEKGRNKGESTDSNYN